MIRPLTKVERALWNVEQPGARITTDLQSENGPHRKLREAAVRDRVWAARWRAEQKGTA